MSALGDPRGVGLIDAAGKSSADCLGRSALWIACEVAEPREGRCGKNADDGDNDREFDDRKAVISTIDLVPHPDFSLPLSATRVPSSSRRLTRSIELRSSIPKSLQSGFTTWESLIRSARTHDVRHRVYPFAAGAICHIGR